VDLVQWWVWCYGAELSGDQQDGSKNDVEIDRRYVTESVKTNRNEETSWKEYG
jgi:hypothetical protein